MREGTGKKRITDLAYVVQYLALSISNALTGVQMPLRFLFTNKINPLLLKKAELLPEFVNAKKS